MVVIYGLDQQISGYQRLEKGWIVTGNRHKVPGFEVAICPSCSISASWWHAVCARNTRGKNEGFVL
jgi:hypothetical protein